MTGAMPTWIQSGHSLVRRPKQELGYHVFRRACESRLDAYSANYVHNAYEHL